MPAVVPIVSAAVVGGWLQLSIFLWPHSFGQTALALVGGILFIVLAALRLRQWRWAAASLITVSIWLGAGALLLPWQNPLSVANHLLASAAVLAFTWRAGV
jgi:hypothetical protein